MTRRGVWLASLCAAAALLAGCSVGGGPASTAGIDALRDLADRQTDRPIRVDRRTDDTADLPDAAFADGPDARRSLAEAMDEFGSFVEPETQVDEPSGEDRADALRAYASGRSALIAGEIEDAVLQLEIATELDPGSAEAWRAYGEAQEQSGLGASASNAYAQAADFGLSEPRPLIVAGLDALARERHDRAARLLARAAANTSADADPAVRPVAYAGLGRALLALGWVAAGAEALEEGVRLPERVNGITRLPRPLSELYARRVELLTRAGDAWLALGDFREADAVYARAAEQPGLDPGAVRTRRLNVALRLGRPASAALLTVERLLDADGVVDERDVATLREVAGSHGPTAEAARRALADVRSSLGEVSPTVAVGLARAEAACVLDAGERRALLGEVIKSLPLASVPAGLLVRDALAGGVTPQDAVAFARSVVADRPDQFVEVSGRLVLSVERPGRLPALIESAGDAPSDALLRASVLAALERPAEAVEAARVAAGGEGSVAAWGRVALADSGSQSGDWDALLEAVDLARSAPADAESAVASAVVLSVAGLEDESTGLAMGASDAEPGWFEAALLAWRYAAAAGRGADAERLRARAEEIDRFDTRVYEVRLQQARRANDPEAGREAARDLRTARPSSRFVRRVAAQERLQAGVLTEPEEDLRTLVAEDPGDGEAIAALGGAWTRAEVTAEEARAQAAWLRDEIDETPRSANLTRLLAQRLAVGGEPEGAIAAIDAFESATGSGALTRQREALLRDELGRIDEADALKVQRLSRTPLPFEETLEKLVDRANEDDEAVIDLLRSAFPDRLRFSSGQRVALSRLVSAASAAFATEARTDPLMQTVESRYRPVLDLADWGIERGVPLVDDVHRLRLTLLVGSRAGAQELGTALADAAETGDQFLVLLSRALADELIDQGRSDVLIGAFDRAMIREAADGSGPELVLPVFTELFRAHWMVSDATGARPFIDRLIETGLLEDAVGPESGPEIIAFELAIRADNEDDSGRAESFYRLALEYNDRHAWTGNNLGYLLLEQNDPETIGEAESLIEMAYIELNGEASVTDSLGWVRYRLGVIEDEIDGDGNIVRAGAVSLLRRADGLSSEEDDGVVTDHLGDALYVAGDIEGAREAWVRAQGQMLRSLRAFQNAQNIQGSPLQTKLNEISAKLRALVAQTDVPVAPTAALGTYPPSSGGPSEAPAGLDQDADLPG